MSYSLQIRVFYAIIPKRSSMNIFKKYKNVIGNVLLILFVAIVLALSVRGLPGNPTVAELNTTQWKDNGPFELSPERGRYAFLYSLVENHSFSLEPQLAVFTSPDVGYWKGHYVSIFAPSISFLAIPGYLIGKHFGMAQFGTFAGMSLFALLNVLLIRLIAIRLGANSVAATISAIAFLFGTPAFAYAVTIYEHHTSVFLMLLSFYLLIRFNNFISLFAIWLLYAFAFTVDYPNLFMMFPIALGAFFRSSIVEKIQKKLVVRISLPRLFSMIGLIFPLIFFLWVNQMSYGSPLKISGSVPTIEGVNKNGSPIFLSDLEKAELSKNKSKAKQQQPVNIPPPSALSFFEPRNMLNGFYILLFSPDRGIIMYAPIILFGIFGMMYAGRKKERYLPITLGVIGFNFLLYSMWGDPYGGWAFGGRYLIPAYAILSIYTAVLLTRFGKNKAFLLLFFIVFTYSISVNSLGALTSNSNPPQIQAASLSEITHSKVDYTYVRNINDLNSDISKSFVFTTFADNYISAWQYYSYITMFILTVSAFILMYYLISLKDKLKKGGKDVL